MDITVTQLNIDNGTRKSLIHCPVTESLRDRGYSKCSVSTYYIIPDRYAKDSCKSWIKTPQEVVDFIKKYDETGIAEPFSFTLPL
jgi:hypothetical protein